MPGRGYTFITVEQSFLIVDYYSKYRFVVTVVVEFKFCFIVCAIPKKLLGHF